MLELIVILFAVTPTEAESMTINIDGDGNGELNISYIKKRNVDSGVKL
jgi:hypothetical protein